MRNQMLKRIASVLLAGGMAEKIKRQKKRQPITAKIAAKKRQRSRCSSQQV